MYFLQFDEFKFKFGTLKQQYKTWLISLLWHTVTDVAGEVVEVGPGANRFKPGDKVVSMVSYMVSISGFYLYCLPIFCSNLSH